MQNKASLDSSRREALKLFVHLLIYSNNTRKMRVSGISKTQETRNISVIAERTEYLLEYLDSQNWWH